MLLLSRKRNEKIMIGDRIWIMVVDIRGDQAQIGVHAPKAVPVHRFEIYEQIQDGVIRPTSRTTIPEGPPLTDENTNGMLILSRKRDEKIMIGDDISVMLVAIRGDMVQIGIDAPRNVPVHRYEIFEEIVAAVKAAGEVFGLESLRKHTLQAPSPPPPPA